METEEIVKLAVKNSQSFLNKNQKIMPICLIFTKKKELHLVGMAIDKQNKEIIKQDLRKKIANLPTEKYAIIMDTDLTAIDKKSGKIEVKGCLAINVYSPQTKVFVGITYKNKDIINGERITMEGRQNMKDEWDIWGEGCSPDEYTDIYNKFKEENKDKYGN